MQFTPFRAVLSDRCQRQIRRNGLSEEGNAFYADYRSTKAQDKLKEELDAKDEELAKLKAELEAARKTNEGDDVADSSRKESRIDEVEAELEQLRQSFNGALAADADHEQAVPDADLTIDWSEVSRTPRARELRGLDDADEHSDSGDTIQIFEDDDARTDHVTESQQSSDTIVLTQQPSRTQLEQDTEILGMVLDLEAAKQEKRRLFQDVRSHLTASFTDSLHFADSPASSQQKHNEPPSSIEELPSPPKGFFKNLSKSLSAATSRAETAELALHNLEGDLKDLGLPGSDAEEIVAALRAQFKEARLELERIVPGENVSRLNEPAKFVPEILSKLKLLSKKLSDRDAELRAMRENQKILKGNFDHSLMISDKANARIRELETVVEEQTEEMLHARMHAQRLEREKNDAEGSVTKLLETINKYRNDIARLEDLIEGMEKEHTEEQEQAKLDLRQSADAQNRLQKQLDSVQTAQQTSFTEQQSQASKIEELEDALSHMHRHSLDLANQMAAVVAKKNAEESELKQQLMKTDAHVAEHISALNTRISSLSTALTCANAEVTKLEAMKTKLEDRIRLEIVHGERSVETMQNEMIKSLNKVNESRKSYIRGAKVRAANAELEDEAYGSEAGTTPMTPVSLVRFADVEDGAASEGSASTPKSAHVRGSIEVGRGSTRRGLGIRTKKSARKEMPRDSGIGMDTLSEVDEESVMTDVADVELPPAVPSSEADIEMA